MQNTNFRFSCSTLRLLSPATTSRRIRPARFIACLVQDPTRTRGCRRHLFGKRCCWTHRAVRRLQCCARGSRGRPPTPTCNRLSAVQMPAMAWRFASRGWVAGASMKLSLFMGLLHELFVQSTHSTVLFLCLAAMPIRRHFDHKVAQSANMQRKVEQGGNLSFI